MRITFMTTRRKYPNIHVMPKDTLQSVDDIADGIQGRIDDGLAIVLQDVYVKDSVYTYGAGPGDDVKMFCLNPEKVIGFYITE